MPTISKATKVPKNRWKLALPFELTKWTWVVCERGRERERKRVSQCERARVRVRAQMSECINYECLREFVSLSCPLRKGVQALNFQLKIECNTFL